MPKGNGPRKAGEPFELGEELRRRGASQRELDEVELTHKVCPNYCHRCPDMGGGIMPFCNGTAIDLDRNDFSRCTCQVEMQCARNAAGSLVENFRQRLPEALRGDLERFANSTVPGRRSTVRKFPQ